MFKLLTKALEWILYQIDEFWRGFDEGSDKTSYPGSMYHEQAGDILFSVWADSHDEGD